MSDAKMFAFKAPETAEDRLDEIERKYGVIQGRIQAYDQVLDEFAAVKKELNQSRQDLASLHDFFESHAKEVKASISSFIAQIQPLKSVQDSHARALQGHSTTIAGILQHASDKHVEVRASIDEMGNKLAAWASDHLKIHAFLDEAKRRISEISTKQINHSNSLDNLYADYIKFKDKSEEIDESLNKEVKNNKQSIQELPSFNKWGNEVYTRVCTNLDYRDKQATAYVDKKIDGLAQEFAANPLSAQSIKAELANEIQSLTLDSKNAYLKSNNCATQIQLLEKKLENLNLIIKKYELNK